MDTHDLISHRAEIDQIDEQIVALLSQRFSVTKQVGLFKAQQQLTAVDTLREAQQAKRYDALASLYGLNPVLIQCVFRCIIDQVVSDHRSCVTASTTK